MYNNAVQRDKLQLQIMLYNKDFKSGRGLSTSLLLKAKHSTVEQPER